MNKNVYEQLGLSLGKNMFIFIYLANELSPNPSFGSISKRVKLKNSNVFVNKLVSMKLDLNIYYMFICIKIYLFILDIILYKFVNKFLRYQISICNLF